MAFSLRRLCFMPTTHRIRFLSTGREAMNYDVVIVGAGPAGLSAAIKLKQNAQKRNKEISVCIVEKGADVGSHILSGNVFDPKALNELIPDWKAKGAPLETPVTKDKLVFQLTQTVAVPLPVPPPLQNHGNYVISLGALCRWLKTEAETLGVEIYPGFSASEVLYENNSVVGVATSDLGIAKDGSKSSSFQSGMELRGRLTLFAEGARGSLSETVMHKYKLRKDCDPQTYGIGLKEVWQVDPKKHEPGLVRHSIGWPTPWNVWGGSFLYHMKPNLVLIGYVIGLDYKNPYLNPYQEFQKWKLHPSVRSHLDGGKCISYGARVINEGGLQAVPKLTFSGGALIGCSAGFLNVPRLKGSHMAMKSGMLAADAATDALEKDGVPNIASYEDSIKKSWVFDELRQVRNVHPALNKFGFLGWLGYGALESFVLKGRGSWTFRNHTTDAAHTEPASKHKQPNYPKPDGVLTFDLLSNLQRSGVNHNEDQPAHLRIKPELAHIPTGEGFSVYAAPETRFCPAKVYEIVEEQGKPKLVINAQNCVHCKTCSIKTTREYINWTVPEGGGGPNYENM